MIALLATLALSAAPAPAPPGPEGLASALALPAITERPAMASEGGAIRPELWLAQRAIDREWGLSDDSTYVTFDLPGWKSEPAALLTSAALPGSGQLYVGEGSGWAFLAAEVGGWVGRHFSERKADRYAGQAATLVGDPRDSSSTFSFERYAARSGGDPAALEALWDGDRSAFYSAIAHDPAWLAGFRGTSFDDYASLTDRADATRRQTRWIEGALWFNHLWSAFDALRAARAHNLPLRTQSPVRLGFTRNRSGDGYVAALTRRF